ncbi:helix-turn-helix domain-containing protein [Rhodococcus sp. T2V]|uniref:helix-turn-helix domain-containing protein n=1 Tax=Rhodococcus sp. T2V TaxID=3034164 RepID=UPI0023E0DB34|nr:helix-turn-helix domain-containing protein [Rhodococcus sp. T2V]MDF3309883.1 helix-turn-helix domain-containing protein [Rhodococcus sp. T2V]
MNGPAVQKLGNALLLQGPAIADAYWLVSTGIRAAERNGHAVRPDVYRLQALLGECHRDALSALRHHDVAPPPDDESSDVELISTREAAEVLNVSPRHVQRIAASLDGRRTAGRWIFDRAVVEAYAAHANAGEAA